MKKKRPAPRRKRFRVIPHTSEVGLQAVGRSLPELFRNAAAGLFHLAGLAPGGRSRSQAKVRVRLEADDAGGLLVLWLNELIFLVYTRRLLPKKFIFNVSTETTIVAEVAAAPLGTRQAAALREVKSATRHALSVRSVRNGWEAEVLFDV